MTSLSRRKRPTTRRPTTPSRTIASLAVAGWLAGAAAAQPPGLLTPPASADLQVAPAIGEPPPLDQAFTRPSALPGPPAPLLPPVKRPIVPPPRTLYYQKDPEARPKPVTVSTAPARAQAKPAAPAPAPEVRQVAGQLPGRDIDTVKLPRSVEEALRRKELPRPEVIFNIKSEQQILEEIRREVGDNKTFATFPGDLSVDKGGYQPLSTEAFAGRNFPPMVRPAEPAYIVHHRLYFEELNSERYGWEVGPLQPFISTAYFFKDLAMLPYNFAARPCQRYDTNYGKCLPGNPVPYVLYPTELSLAGGIAEAGVIVGLFALFP
jgi:hypothetical protein